MIYIIEQIKLIFFQYASKLKRIYEHNLYIFINFVIITLL